MINPVTNLPVLGLMLGDMTGIGPEISAKLLAGGILRAVAHIAGYHDHGQIATKLLGFNKGVTVTAGLKTVFTTPALGAAFDIVGQGQADTGALEQALRIAARMASARAQPATRH